MTEARPVTASKPSSFYIQVEITGLLLVAVGSLLSIVPEPPVGIIVTVLSLVVAGIVWRIGRWALLLGAVYGLPPLVIAVVLTTISFVYPGSFLEFVPLLLVLGVGGLMAIIGGAFAYARYRRGDGGMAATAAQRVVLRAVVGVTAALAILSGTLAVTGRTSVSAEDREGATEVVLRNFEIVPDRLEFRAGKPIQLIVRNDAWNLHTFTVVGVDADYPMRPRSERLVQLPALKPGTYTYMCRVVGHDAMQGTLVVN